MKQLTCEMCGGTELIKQEGVFVCQSCGCKYSVEEAKRMMVEGTVEVQGTVSIDSTSFIEKSLINARRAKDKEDWEETEKYYNSVEKHDPSNIEAIFYSAYGKVMRGLVTDSDIFKRKADVKVLRNCISIIDDNYSIEKQEEQKAAIKQISDDLFKMFNTGYVYTKTRKVAGNASYYVTDQYKTRALFNELEFEFATSLVHIAAMYPEDDKENLIFFMEIIVNHLEAILQRGDIPNARAVQDLLTTTHNHWHDLDPEHKTPEMIQQENWEKCKEEWRKVGEAFKKAFLGGHDKQLNRDSRYLYVFSAVLLGWLGIHNFQTGYIKAGIAKIVLTLTGYGFFVSWIWAIVDIFKTKTTKDGLPLEWKFDKGIFDVNKSNLDTNDESSSNPESDSTEG